MSYLRNSTSLLSSLCCLLMTFCMMARSSAVRWDMSGLVDVVLVPLPTTGGVPPRPTPPPEEKGAADAPTVTDEWGTLIKLRVCSQKNAILSTNCLFFKRCGYILICKTLTQTLRASLESSYLVGILLFLLLKWFAYQNIHLDAVWRKMFNNSNILLFICSTGMGNRL